MGALQISQMRRVVVTKEHVGGANAWEDVDNSVWEGKISREGI